MTNRKIKKKAIKAFKLEEVWERESYHELYKNFYSLSYFLKHAKKVVFGCTYEDAHFLYQGKYISNIFIRRFWDCEHGFYIRDINMAISFRKFNKLFKDEIIVSSERRLTESDLIL